MLKEETDWSKYSNDSIDYIFSQSEKLMQEIFVSYRENLNKSYAALAIYITLFSYCFTKIVESSNNKHYVYYLLLSIGIGISIIILFTNLNPKKMDFIGSYKSLLCQDYYENYIDKEKQIREFKIHRIEDFDLSIKKNMSYTIAQIELFKHSVLIFSSTLCIVFFLFCFFR